MAPSSAKIVVARPVQTLREQATALEAAIALTLVKPGKKPVHALRTATRRIEAQLQILTLLESEDATLIGAVKASAKVKKLLGAVRKAAGKVRDLDVQRELIKQSLEGSARKRTRHEGRYLRSELKAQRSEEAAELLQELEGHAQKLAPKLEKLLQQLEPAAGLTIQPARFTRLIEGWYVGKTSMGSEGETQLHNLRKAAKLARYMAESANAKSIARGFERTQQLGGDWHDVLTMKRTAREHLGKHATLAACFSQKEEQALSIFRDHISPAGSAT